MQALGFNKIYPFATENVKGYFKRLDLQDKKVLTVGSSLDQAFNAYLLGAKDITVLDINPATEEFYHLKREIILKVDRQDLYQIMTNASTLQQFTSQTPSGNISISKDVLSEDAVFALNNYLESDETYEHLRTKLKHFQPTFITGDVFKLDEILSEQYDRIILSNILQYITTFYPNQDPYEVLKKSFDIWIDYLSSNGILQLLYLYSYSLEDAKKNDHPIPTYRLRDVHQALKPHQLNIEWLEGTLYPYNKYDQDAIVTYKKER